MIKKRKKHLKWTAIIALTLMLGQNLNAQSIKDVIINEYYWGTPLTEVVDDLKTKYGLQVKYDPVFIANFKFSNNGRLGTSGTGVERVLSAICDDFPELSFYIDENDVIYLEKKIASTKTSNLANVKYKGKSEKTNIKVSGIIKDSETGESLSFTSIAVKGTNNGAITNIDGYFTLFKVPSDTSTLIVSYVGYEATTFFLNPKIDLSNLVIKMKPSAESIDEVVISAERSEMMRSTNQVSVVKMSPKKMSLLPSVGETDIFRSFQLLPGVSGSNEASSGLFVRGGTPDQNLILYDGFTVYHVDHLFGMFSAFNSNAVKDVQLHKGGFESQFGGRISSVMEIIGKDGNENDFNIGGSIGLLSANLFTEIPIKDKVTILLAGRRSWKSPIYNSIFENFNATAEPTNQMGGATGGGKITESTTPDSYFYDLNAKVTYKPTAKDIISYSFFNGKDDLDNSRTIERTRNGTAISGGVNDITEWGSWGMSTTWSRKWSDVFYTNTLGSTSNYFSNRDLSNSRIITDSDGETSEVSRGSLEDNNLRDYTFKLNNELKLSQANQLEFGLQSTYYKVDYDYSLNDTISIQERNDDGTVTSVFLQDRIQLFNRRVTLIPGIRSSYYDLTEETYNEPRASINLKLTNKIKLKGAWGHYYQFANRIIRNDISSGSRDFWVLSDDITVPISYSEHYIVGASYETDGYLFDVEAYHKNLSGLSEYSLQFAPSFNNVDFNEFFYEGQGTARGVEFLFQKKFGGYNGWLGYTLGEVLYDFPIYGENPFYANHDVTNEFKIVNTYKHKNWTFAATWIYATGKPYTEPIGGYTITLLDGSLEDFIEIGEKNNARYPDYHRLDLSATLDFKMAKTNKASLGFSIFNLYNRENTWYKEFEVEDGELIETDVKLLGFTPSVTLSIKLR